jgi:tripartite-type tricarboxylate transporter receptor subunit TctC
MNKDTALHVIWGVFNNPNTPEAMKDKIKDRLQKAVEKNDSKLAKKIAIVVNS